MALWVGRVIGRRILCRLLSTWPRRVEFMLCKYHRFFAGMVAASHERTEYRPRHQNRQCKPNDPRKNGSNGCGGVCAWKGP
jgi:hypothetical protein